LPAPEARQQIQETTDRKEHPEVDQAASWDPLTLAAPIHTVDKPQRDQDADHRSRDGDDQQAHPASSHLSLCVLAQLHSAYIGLRRFENESYQAHTQICLSCL
jgi:hypothetical protein